MREISADRPSLADGAAGAPDGTTGPAPSLPAQRPRGGPLAGSGRLILLASSAGLGVGGLTSLGQTLLGSTAFAGLGNAVSPWLVLPFAVGALARRDGHASAAGLLACVAQVFGYYLVAHLRGFGVSNAFLIIWAVAGVLGGPLFGWAGRAWRTATGRVRGLGPALLVGCWVSEAIVTYLVVLRYGSEAAVFGAVAAVLTVLLGVAGRQLRSLLTWLPAACLLGGAGFAALHTLL
ncbi:DUF6518 family protein [Cellulomonas carbonis]|uniref:Uncharacterized protein n=1 Tax=Cellulomonas carbonis T26 TaxID=947969 RepID=A0A0A0BQD1_9CELL|nr:DUF6518 family protein [Cellulomonas carbonis]KGM09274.1 hypothetical protein N868_03165 [Cellulomonas carbonis T26]GGC17110.1 hypothetical protein GCM10010972_33010 [Cellulomonas carbonis]